MLLDLVDRVVERSKLRDELAKIVQILTPQKGKKYEDIFNACSTPFGIFGNPVLWLPGITQRLAMSGLSISVK